MAPKSLQSGGFCGEKCSTSIDWLHVELKSHFGTIFVCRPNVTMVFKYKAANFICRVIYHSCFGRNLKLNIVFFLNFVFAKQSLGFIVRVHLVDCGIEMIYPWSMKWIFVKNQKLVPAVVVRSQDDTRTRQWIRGWSCCLSVLQS